MSVSALGRLKTSKYHIFTLYSHCVCHQKGIKSRYIHWFYAKSVSIRQQYYWDELIDSDNLSKALITGGLNGRQSTQIWGASKKNYPANFCLSSSTHQCFQPLQFISKLDRPLAIGLTCLVFELMRYWSQVSEKTTSPSPSAAIAPRIEKRAATAPRFQIFLQNWSKTTTLATLGPSSASIFVSCIH